MQRSLRSRFIAIAGAAWLAAPALAGPWVQKKGQGLVIVSMHGYRATERFTLSGSRAPLGAGGEFRSLSPQVWAEYGITDRWTGIFTGSLAALRYEDPGYRASAFAPGDLQAGVRRALRSPENGWQISVQALVKAPAYSSRVEPRPGNGQADLEGTLLAGRSFRLGSRWAFFSSEGGYRKRWGRPADQWRSELGGGLHLNSRWTAFGQLFAIRHAGSLPAIPPGLNPLIEPAFDLYKAQGSAVFRLSPHWKIQAGAGLDFAGRNIGRGRTWMAALWRTF